MNNIFRYLIGFFIGLCVGLCFCFLQPLHVTQKIEYIPVHDTVVVDSTRIINHTTVLYVDRVDTCYVISDKDTVYIKDLPIEHKVYNDTILKDSTSAIVNIKYHGFAADIDSLNIIYNYYNKETTIYLKPKKYGLDIVIGPTIGYGYGLNGPSPYAGVGVTIGFGYRITR